MSAITFEDQQKITALLDTMPVLSVGVGTRESACSIAAINLALSNTLTDKIPACMSHVIGSWIIKIQDGMPYSIRNSPRWRALLPRAAGTGRELEEQRRNVVIDWMWGIVLPQLQPFADEQGFGSEWRNMQDLRTFNAAAAGTGAAYAAANAAYDAAHAANAAYSTMYAANAACFVSNVDGLTDYWKKIDPCGLLEKLIEVK